jgi:ankyrin repeat protein
MKGDNSMVKQTLALLIISSLSLFAGAKESPKLSNQMALIRAIKSNNQKQLVNLIKSKLLINFADQDGNTPLHFATYARSWKLCKQLIDAGALVNCANSKNAAFDLALLNTKLGGTTPLMLAAFKGDFFTLEYLLKKGANPNAQDNLGQSPLTYALLASPKWPHEPLNSKQTKCVELLLDNGSNPLLFDSYENTPFYYYECMFSGVQRGLNPHQFIIDKSQNPLYLKFTQALQN